MLEENEFANIITRKVKLPKIDTVRDTVKVVEIEGLKVILQHTVKKL
jgi:hypothetical protein